MDERTPEEPTGVADEASPEPVSENETDRAAQPVDPEGPPRLPFPVVGIGASAGGLEALTEFIKTMRADCGMAFVVIQHLPPDRDSLLSNILSQHTSMPVQQVEDGMAVAVDHVYVIRPGHVLTMRDGALHLGPQLGTRAANRPVDDFFKSLAEEQRERGICIIMSGMGSNGTAGCRAIKAVGGLCIAQDPDTAQFPSMPRHLIDAGYADYILRPADMADVLLAYAGHPYARGRRSSEAAAKRDERFLREILALLRTRTKQDYSGYKKPTVLRRVQRRMGLNRVVKMGEYVGHLRQTPSELAALADDLLIHVTGFFRDADAWEALRQNTVVPLVASREREESVRCWVTACSSGEEAYTLAMLLVEESERTGKYLDIKVFATDLVERSLAHARAGIYPGGIEAEITPSRLDRFFQKEDEMYRVRPDLRERVIFAPQNVLQDPPFSRIDIASCRNLLIYLEPELQRRVMSLLHFVLREGGTLFLGTSETIGDAEDMFEVVDKRARIYRRVGPTRHGAFEFPLPRPNATSGGTAIPRFEQRPRADGRGVPRPSLAQMTQRTLIEHHTPAAVLVDRDHRVLYFHGNTRPFLDQPAGEPTRDLMLLAREGVRGAARIALHRAAAEQKPVTVVDGWIAFEDGHRGRIAVSASPLADRDAPDYFVVSFEERAEIPVNVPGEGAEHGGNGKDLSDELQRVRDELQSTIEELQTSNEELKASNEETMSINEELQSANEELETSKEEMQSLNEELTTVNAQLQAKMEEHQAARNDLASLLTSTDIAVIFLDAQLHIRRYTPAVRDLVEVISSDIGRPLSDLAKKFTDPSLGGDTERVLAKLMPIEREVAADGGRWYLRRITPYRTSDNRIDGVVVTFVEITARQRTEEALRASEEQSRQLTSLMPAALYACDADGTIAYFNNRAAELWGQSPVVRDPKWTLCGARQLRAPDGEPVSTEQHPMRLVLDSGEPVVNREMVIERPDRSRIDVLINVNPLRDAAGQVVGAICVFQDISERNRSEAALRRSEQRLRRAMEIETVSVVYFDDAGRFTDANNAMLRMSGYSRDALAAGQVSWTSMATNGGQDQVRAAMDEYRATGHTTAQEVKFARRDGSRWWGLLSAQRLSEIEGVGFIIDVSSTRRAEASVRESDLRQSAIFAQAGVGLAEMSFDGRLQHVNDELSKMLGRGAQEVTDSDLSTIAHPDDLPRLLRSLRDLLIVDQPISIDHRFRRPDGSVVWASSRLTRLNDESGQPQGALAVVVDLTERKRSEGRDRLLIELDDAIRRATDAREIATVACRLLAVHLGSDRSAYAEVEPDQDTFTVVAEHSPGSPSILGRFRMSEADPRMRRQLLANRPMREHDVKRSDLPPEQIQGLERLHIRAVLDVPIVKDGRFVAFLGVCQSTPRTWTEGDIEIVRLVANRCRDAVERVAAEQALRESQERLQMAIESAHMGFWDWNMSAGTVKWERIHNEMMGLPLDQHMGTPEEFIARVHPDDRARVKASLDDAVAGRADYRAEFRAVHPNGTTRWIAGYGRGFTEGSGGRMTRIIGGVMDITDRKAGEAERARLLDREQAARAEAETASRMKDEFLATLSHELRTPLSAILLWSKLLKGKQLDPQQLEEGLSAITMSAESQKELIDDLLDTSRITSGKLRLQLREVDAATLIGDAVEAVQPAAEARGVSVTTRIESSGGAVLADPDRLRQVLWNLLTNAVKFTPADGRVVVTLVQTPSTVTVSVADTGQGIPADFLPHVFERFRQADASSTRRFGGMGLGLAITKQLVELHGGTISAASPGSGQGATFTIELPLPAIRARRTVRQAPARAGKRAKPVDALNDTTVLLIEDDVQTRNGVATTLRRAGATVTAVGSAPDALAAFDAARPDMIVSDIGLPSMDGYELMRAIRAREKTAKSSPIPAIALTAFVRPEDERKAADAGFQQHLGKPVDPERLVAVLAKMVE